MRTANLSIVGYKKHLNFTNKFLIFSLLLLFFSFKINAQITMDANGDMGLHSTSVDESIYIYRNGNVKINSYYHFNQSGTLRPLSSSNSNYIGNSSFPFAYIYGTYIYANGNLLGSDERSQ